MKNTYLKKNAIKFLFFGFPLNSYLLENKYTFSFSYEHTHDCIIK